MWHLTIRSDRVTDERVRALLEAGEYLDDDALDALERVGERVADPEAYLASEGVDGWYLDEDGHSHWVANGDLTAEQAVRVVGPAPGFYGTDWATYYVTTTGRIWLVQSDDVEARYLPREVQALDDRAEPIPDGAITPAEAAALVKGTED